MADQDNVLFIRGNNENNIATDTDDVWDDTALIKAYDRAVNLAKDEVAKRMGVEAPSSSQGKHNKSQYHKQNQPRTILNKVMFERVFQIQYNLIC